MARVYYEPIDTSLYSPAPIIGVDEVGRGCLAGPVYAAAVILNSDYRVDEFTDSKLISESRREELANVIEFRHKVGIGFATVQEIEELNILWAAMLAMKRAVESLVELTGVSNGHVLVDGNRLIPSLDGFSQTAIVKGDLRVKEISAASIVAKVARDQYVKRLGVVYPEYGFESHKGYSTPEHKNAIAKFGPCREHRQSFAGVKEFWNEDQLRSPSL